MSPDDAKFKIWEEATAQPWDSDTIKTPIQYGYTAQRVKLFTLPFFQLGRDVAS